MKPWNVKIFCSIFRHHPSISQSMALCITVQVKTISPFELFPYPTCKTAISSSKLKMSIRNSLPLTQEYSKVVTLGHYFYLLFTADLPISPETTPETFVDDTALIVKDNYPAIASSKLQTNLLAIQSWLAKWRMKANGSKSTHIIHHAKRHVSPGSHQQCPTPSNRRGQVSRAAPRQKTHLA
jgi:hypothetical protein